MSAPHALSRQTRESPETSEPAGSGCPDGSRSMFGFEDEEEEEATFGLLPRLAL
jgi:hypothetical protein